MQQLTPTVARPCLTLREYDDTIAYELNLRAELVDCYCASAHALLPAHAGEYARRVIAGFDNLGNLVYFADDWGKDANGKRVPLARDGVEVVGTDRFLVVYIRHEQPHHQGLWTYPRVREHIAAPALKVKKAGKTKQSAKAADDDENDLAQADELTTTKKKRLFKKSATAESKAKP